ncbi:MAG: 50S ribosomal protein L10 [Acidobacteria bacterium]|nr:MAG: 50S ribosomal protein L10 [Acidobacteriota bacterium]
MPRTRAEKEKLVEEIRTDLGRAETIFLVSLAGISSNDINDLRARLRKQGARMRVVKNRLARRAAGDGAWAVLEDLFRGPTAIVYHEQEPVETAKTLVAFAKDHPQLEIKGGLVSGRDRVDPAGVKAVAELPSLDEARAMLLQVINGPATSLARLLNTPASQLVTVLTRRSEQEG